LWGVAVGGALVLGIGFAWFSRRFATAPAGAAAVPPAASAASAANPAPPVEAPAPVVLTTIPGAQASDAAVATTRPASRAVPIQQLPTAGTLPPRGLGTRRPKPAAPATGTPPPAEDIPRNPYR
jgi:hypothetical protein